MSLLHVVSLGQGPDLVLLHGWGMNHAIWQEFAQQLASDYRVHLVDLPGYGHSETVTPWTLTNVAQQLRQQLPENAIWLGWSLGGLVATEVDRQFPEYVRALVMLASSPQFMQNDCWPGIKPAVLAQFAQQLQQDIQTTISRFLAIQAMGVENAKLQVRQLKQQILALPLPDDATLRAGLDVLQHANCSDAWRNSSTPRLAILGKLDSLVPVSLQQQLTHWPVDVVVLSKASHAPFVSHREEVTETVKNWIEKLSSDA